MNFSRRHLFYPHVARVTFLAAAISLVLIKFAAVLLMPLCVMHEMKASPEPVIEVSLAANAASHPVSAVNDASPAAKPMMLCHDAGTAGLCFALVCSVLVLAGSFIVVSNYRLVGPAHAARDAVLRILPLLQKVERPPRPV